MTARAMQLALLALCRIEGVTGAQWQMIARQASVASGLQRLVEGVIDERGRTATKLRENLTAGLPQLDRYTEEAVEALHRAEDVQARLVTVLDDEYPPNLRAVYNLPPFLFVQGRLEEDDLRSVAVVGTREPSSDGLTRARQMAGGLAEQRVTVASGLAAGIDAAAHEACLEAGGRTIAVTGTGIRRTYPASNEALRERILAEGGAILSQFWPDQPPGRHTFPLRNVVMSGISQGTVVIEASDTSGARMQARLATEHGKQVFLLHSLVTDFDWARTYVSERRAVEVRSVNDVVRHLASPEKARAAHQLREQLSLQLS